MAPVFGLPSLETRNAAPGQVSGALRENGIHTDTAFSLYRNRKQVRHPRLGELRAIGTFRPVAEIVRDVVVRLAVGDGK